MAEAMKVLDKTSQLYPECQFEFESALIGGAAYDEFGVHFPDVTRDICARSDCIFFLRPHRFLSVGIIGFCKLLKRWSDLRLRCWRYRSWCFQSSHA